MNQEEYDAFADMTVKLLEAYRVEGELTERLRNRDAELDQARADAHAWEIVANERANVIVQARELLERAADELYDSGSPRLFKDIIEFLVPTGCNEGGK